MERCDLEWIDLGPQVRKWNAIWRLLFFELRDLPERQFLRRVCSIRKLPAFVLRLSAIISWVEKPETFCPPPFQLRQSLALPYPQFKEPRALLEWPCQKIVLVSRTYWIDPSRLPSVYTRSSLILSSLLILKPASIWCHGDTQSLEIQTSNSATSFITSPLRTSPSWLLTRMHQRSSRLNLRPTRLWDLAEVSAISRCLLEAVLGLTFPTFPGPRSQAPNSS